MASIRPGVTIAEVSNDAGARMAAIISAFKFTDPKIKDAATRFAAPYQAGKPRNGLGHGLGMEVHDVTIRRDAFQPGELFTIEPAIQIPDESLAMRIEDVILDHREGLREPLGVRPDRNCRYREADARTRAERLAGEGATEITGSTRRHEVHEDDTKKTDMLARRPGGPA